MVRGRVGRQWIQELPALNEGIRVPSPYEEIPHEGIRVSSPYKEIPRMAIQVPSRL